MLDIQRRWSEAFRIRLGEKRTSNGKEYPAALDGQIRVTSRSKATIDAIGAAYGAVTTDWNDQHEARLPTDELRIVVLPGDACVGWWEQWRKKAGGMPVCTHRCDGHFNYQADSSCTCPSMKERMEHRDRYCQPTTRLWIMLPDVEVIGAGRLETHGIIAAETLPQSVSVLQGALSQGELVPAVLRIVKVESSGKSFVVPQIEVVGLSLDSLLAGSVSRAAVGAGPASLSEGAASPDVSPGEGGPASELEEPSQGPPSPSPSTRDLNAIRKQFAIRKVVKEEAMCKALAIRFDRPITNLRELTPDEVLAVLGA